MDKPPISGSRHEKGTTVSYTEKIQTCSDFTNHVRSISSIPSSQLPAVTFSHNGFLTNSKGIACWTKCLRRYEGETELMQCKCRSVLMSPLISDNTYNSVTENSSNICICVKKRRRLLLQLWSQICQFISQNYLLGFD